MPWRRWLTTTPGRLRSASTLLVIGLLVFAAVTTAATEARSRAAGTVATTSAPELVTAENLYGNLADADATASTIFLRAGQDRAGCAAGTSTTWRRRAVNSPTSRARRNRRRPPTVPCG